MSLTLVLAGNRKQYCDFVGSMYPAKPEEFFDGHRGMFYGIHFSKVIVIGTFFYLMNATKIIDYARVCLDPNGALVYTADVKYPPSPINEEVFMKLPNPFLLPKTETTMPKVTPKIRTVGEIWVLNKANAPFNSKQWGYQGSSKTPYVITGYANKKDGSTTSAGWACSCMSFTRNVPRTPCKHILNVMLKENVPVNKASAKLANVDDETMAAFKKWEREKAAKEKATPTDPSKLKHFGATGRKFR